MGFEQTYFVDFGHRRNQQFAAPGKRAAACVRGWLRASRAFPAQCRTQVTHIPFYSYSSFEHSTKHQ
jgi:hypothetical protein